MSENNLKILFSLIIVAIILIAGWYPFKKKITKKPLFPTIDFPIGEALSTGIFLGAGLLHMLPEANKLFFEYGYFYPLAPLITGGVFLFFLWFEHLGKELYGHNPQTKLTHPTFAITAWAMLSIHSLMLGSALGINHNQSIVLILFLATISHKWAESFALSLQLAKSSLTFWQGLLFFLSFALMTPIGILIGCYTDLTSSLIPPVLISASSGTFFYLGTLHGLQRSVMVQRCCNLRDFSFVIIGFMIMSLVAIYI